MLFIFYEFHCYYDIYSTAVQIVEEIRKNEKIDIPAQYEKIRLKLTLF